jgi:hypothetical protein
MIVFGARLGVVDGAGCVLGPHDDVVSPSVRGIGFLLEAGAKIGIGRKMGRENFYGYSTIQASVACAIDFAHAASPERGLNLVTARLCTWSESHP